MEVGRIDASRERSLPLPSPPPSGAVVTPEGGSMHLSRTEEVTATGESGGLPEQPEAGKPSAGLSQ